MSNVDRNREVRSFGLRTGTKVAILVAVLIAIGAAFYFRSKPVPEQALEEKPRSLATDRGVQSDKKTTPLPRLIDLGADKCIPCKMMAPVLHELRREYVGKMEVTVIDVWKNPDAIKQYGIRGIPTQIFYDASGRELFRHVGFLSKEDILAKWKELGIAIEKGSTSQGNP